ncbi:ABC transporter permease [soil metagenome]
MTQALQPVSTSTAADPPEVTPARRHQGFRIHWAVRRLIEMPVNLMVFCVFVFFFARLVPGDPLAASSTLLSEDQVLARRAELGLDDPLLTQLWMFLKSMATFDLGNGITDGQSIADQIAQRLPMSLQLTILGLGASVLVSIVAAFVAALWPRTLIARSIRWVGRSAGAFPDFAVGVLLIFVFYTVLSWAPAPMGPISPVLTMPPRITGFPLLDALFAGDLAAAGSLVEHLWLPVVVIVLSFGPMMLKVLVLAVDSAVNSPQIRFMVSLGVSRPVVLRSVLKTAMPTTIANLGNLTVLVLGGTIVVEQLFSLGGLGQYAVQAVQAADITIVQSFIVVYAAICLVIFLACDLAIAAIDRRRGLDVHSN